MIKIKLRVLSFASAFILSLALSLGLFAQGLPDFSNLSPQQARENIEMIAQGMNSVSSHEHLSNLTGGMDLNMKAYLEGNTLTVEMTNDELWVSSPEMAMFSMASNMREGNQDKVFVMLSLLLDKAGCNLLYVYKNTKGERTEVPLSPQMLADLATKPLNDLPIDRNELLNQAIGIFENGLKEVDDPNIISQECELDGQYICLRQVLGNSLDALENGSLNNELRKWLIISIGSEMGGMPQLSKMCFNVFSRLNIKGLKFDINDLKGHQAVFTVNWKELQEAIENSSANPEATDLEPMLDLIDASVTQGFSEEGLNLKQTHMVIEDVILFTLEVSDEDFATYSDFLTPEFILEAYAEVYDDILKDYPRISGIGMVLESPEHMSDIMLFSPEEIRNALPENTGILVDEDGNIHT